MASYNREMNRGLGRAQNKLNDLKDVKAEIKDRVEMGNTASDLSYYLKMRADNREMFEKKYDELVESDVVKRIFGDEIPDFHSIYSENESFEKGGVKFSLKDLSNLVAFDNMTKVDSSFLKKVFNEGDE